MGISDVIHETPIDLIDGAINYYEEDEYLDLADDEDVLQGAAVHLKVDNRMSYYKQNYQRGALQNRCCRLEGTSKKIYC